MRHFLLNNISEACGELALMAVAQWHINSGRSVVVLAPQKKHSGLKGLLFEKAALRVRFLDDIAEATFEEPTMYFLDTFSLGNGLITGACEIMRTKPELFFALDYVGQKIPECFIDEKFLEAVESLNSVIGLLGGGVEDKKWAHLFEIYSQITEEIAVEDLLED